MSTLGAPVSSALNRSASAGGVTRQASSRWRSSITGTLIWLMSPRLLALPPPSLPISTPEEITAASGRTADCLVNTAATDSAPRLVPTMATGGATLRASAITAATSLA